MIKIWSALHFFDDQRTGIFWQGDESGGLLRKGVGRWSEKFLESND